MGITSSNMLLLTISSLLALSQAQQPDWCLDAETGTMMCLAGSTLHQKAMDAYLQCSNLGDYGSDMPAGRSIFAAAQQKRNVEERQAGQCPPVSDMGSLSTIPTQTTSQTLLLIVSLRPWTSWPQKASPATRRSAKPSTPSSSPTSWKASSGATTPGRGGTIVGAPWASAPSI